MTGPSLFIVGAPKCGTTAMHRILKLHPSLHMSPVKEPNFYLFDGEEPRFGGPLGDLLASQVVASRRKYLDLFRVTDGRDVAHRGESSPFYLYSDVARRAIARDVPHARIVILLRDPILRAHSHYVMLRRDEREPASTFQEALDLEEERLRAGWAPSFGYVRLSRYLDHVPAWLDAFGDNVLVLTHEELRHSQRATLTKVCQFLDVEAIDDLFEFDEEVNVSGIPRSRLLHRFLSGDSPVKSVARAIMEPYRARRLAAWARERNLRSPTLASRDVQRLRSVLGPSTRAMIEILGSRVNQWSTTLPE